MSSDALHCNNVHKRYDDGASVVDVLRGVNLQVAPGEKVAIIGASGSGKSTLLNLLGGLDEVSEGQVELAGKPLGPMSEKARARWRNQHLGFVYQFHHLLSEFSALENVAMPQLIAGKSRSQANQAASELLNAVGLGERLGHRPGQLSGGERQRVAIARSLVNQPSCVLMDEPTGNLDPEAAAQVMRVIEVLSDLNSAFVVVTHDREIAAQLERTYELKNGVLSLLQ